MNFSKIKSVSAYPNSTPGYISVYYRLKNNKTVFLTISGFQCLHFPDEELSYLPSDVKENKQFKRQSEYVLTEAKPKDQGNLNQHTFSHWY